MVCFKYDLQLIFEEGLQPSTDCWCRRVLIHSIVCVTAVIFGEKLLIPNFFTSTDKAPPYMDRDEVQLVVDCQLTHTHTHNYMSGTAEFPSLNSQIIYTNTHTGGERQRDIESIYVVL